MLLVFSPRLTGLNDQGWTGVLLAGGDASHLFIITFSFRGKENNASPSSLLAHVGKPQPRLSAPESIECIIEDQAFSPSNDLVNSVLPTTTE
jgi:hypothetical protein